MLKADIFKNLRDFSLNVNINVAKGRTLVLIGENGAGKSTFLNILSGLIAPDTGEITLNDRIIFSSESKISVSSEERNTGHLFQSYALFPHMSVYENIAFGLTCKKIPKEKINELVSEQMEAMHISDFADVNVKNLSGGQKQRVALARALVLKPDILLLDEPLAAVDVRMQSEMRRELRQRIKAAKIPCVIVTHTLTDALELGDDVAIIERGRIIQSGKPEDVFKKPKSGFVARFTGMENIFRGIAENNNIHKAAETEIRIGEVILHTITEEKGEVIVGIRAEEIILSKEPLDSTARNMLKGKVSEINWNGALSRVIVDTGIPITVAVTQNSMERLNLQTGQEIYVIFKAPAVHVFPA
ncbi:MAG: ABC transporter ATP-binding protein [Methanomicrobium sp.]|nr:ABC transporter ATP-binding protein [Methanomicrobium sp.]